MVKISTYRETCKILDLAITPFQYRQGKEHYISWSLKHAETWNFVKFVGKTWNKPGRWFSFVSIASLVQLTNTDAGISYQQIKVRKFTIQLFGWDENM